MFPAKLLLNAVESIMIGIDLEIVCEFFCVYIFYIFAASPKCNYSFRTIAIIIISMERSNHFRDTNAHIQCVYNSLF